MLALTIKLPAWIWIPQVLLCIGKGCGILPFGWFWAFTPLLFISAMFVLSAVFRGLRQ